MDGNDKGVTIFDIINLPYPMNCCPIGQQMAFAFLFKTIRDVVNKGNRR